MWKEFIKNLCTLSHLDELSLVFDISTLNLSNISEIDYKEIAIFGK